MRAHEVYPVPIQLLSYVTEDIVGKTTNCTLQFPSGDYTLGSKSLLKI
jgi:hypothetical protein